MQKLYRDPPAAFPPKVTLGPAIRDLAHRHGLPWSRLENLLHRLGIVPALLECRPDAVSGGELQRLALARLLALEPAVILADEPASRLDPVTQLKVMTLLGEAAETARAAVLLVTHDAAIAGRWAHRTLPLARSG